MNTNGFARTLRARQPPKLTRYGRCLQLANCRILSGQFCAQKQSSNFTPMQPLPRFASGATAWLTARSLQVQTKQTYAIYLSVTARRSSQRWITTRNYTPDILNGMYSSPSLRRKLSNGSG